MVFNGLNHLNFLIIIYFHLIFSLLICLYSEKWLKNPFIHFSFGVGLGLGILLLTLKEEKEMIHYIYCILRLSRKEKKTLKNK